MPTDTEIQEGRLQALQSRDDEINRLREYLIKIRGICDDKFSADNNSTAQALRDVRDLAADAIQI